MLKDGFGLAAFNQEEAFGSLNYKAVIRVQPPRQSVPAGLSFPPWTESEEEAQVKSHSVDSKVCGLHVNP